ncbi:hypothetical protein T8A63_10895 [Sulfitobacter sp. OXR-159]|uniref:hypothetical protein n=1 Tax=Sulfitobacter sp. OXR-159 TaxID=3100174 RepID=UPI002AC9AAFD|nr:hypothetical protein [Sulfitobacter sp. OXR-159]WPZ28167.1 hypothetical protein T8A63_10895 [Sulfitobacter sp. OXR-159]
MMRTNRANSSARTGVDVSPLPIASSLSTSRSTVPGAAVSSSLAIMPIAFEFASARAAVRSTTSHSFIVSAIVLSFQVVAELAERAVLGLFRHLNCGVVAKHAIWEAS